MTCTFKILKKRFNLLNINKRPYVTTVDIIVLKTPTNPNFKNYTHTIQQWKVDINLMRLMIYTSAFYANNNLISIENYAANPEWTDYTYNSVGYKIAEVVRYAIKGY